MSRDLLTLENILDINEQIKILSFNDVRIEYTGIEDYPIKISVLKKLIELIPINRTIEEIAAYFLKNIIILQAFPDANHRTALTAAERLLEINGYNFDYTPVEAYRFRKELYSRRLHEYGTYEERSIIVLKETDNQVFLLCLDFVKTHIK